MKVDASIVQIITVICAMISAVLSPILVIWVKAKVDAYHREVDGMKTDLVEAVKGRGEAEGAETGRLKQIQEAKDAGVLANKEIKTENITVTSDATAVKATNVTVTKEKGV